MEKISKVIVLLFLLSSLIIRSQTFIGKVVDSQNLALENVAVYFDNTSIGTVTDSLGNFFINHLETPNKPLVFRLVGYEVLVVDNPLKDNLKKIILYAKPEILDDVIIEADPWTRQRKENYFKSYFLGKNQMKEYCKIQNIEDVDLRFSPSDGILYCTSDKPILVEHKKLSYLIEVDLDYFNLTFNKLNMGDLKFSLSPRIIKGAIRTFYKELVNNGKTSKRKLKLRDEVYELSSLRFYRAMINETLPQDNYKMYYEDTVVDTKEHIRVNKVGAFFSIALKNDTYLIEDKFGNKTQIAPLQQIFIVNKNGYLIDENGGISNKRAFAFRGHLGNLGISMRLPDDYICSNCTKL
ncbi:carboxypeptidase-like regulatory domain-containing protein [Winogradskyella luteola]|uniref:Carboxypeptidase-like regulatory domain-containing protein n=1 Tax=Winogradskyella luteola TaxID=2828330 RepID=A0A9X1F8E8_9FLAO|nr:carboxypeptidase-like regulatory domain-containing protein [Winogradskyella luteola]MBV7269001.1 carboxypeptidase-like regulatory domain-containing protein [Winogradskyella luteola]